MLEQGACSPTSGVQDPLEHRGGTMRTRPASHPVGKTDRMQVVMTRCCDDGEAGC